MTEATAVELPGKDCGLCGFRTCNALAERLPTEPELIKRCIILYQETMSAESTTAHPKVTAAPAVTTCDETACGACAIGDVNPFELAGGKPTWKDSLGRDFDFYLEHFPEEPGPREIIIPHNPMITREMDIQPGDVLHRPSTGHVAAAARSPIAASAPGGPSHRRDRLVRYRPACDPRQEGFKDLGYYIAEGYEGLVKEARCELKIGMRYYFQPRMCMLQWRHSGLVNYLSTTEQGLQVRLEGLWIG